MRWSCHYPRVQLLRILRCGAGRVDAPVTLRSLDQQRRIPIRRRHWKLLEETTGESVRMRETQRNGNDSNRNDTHYPVDAVFTHASLGHHHQVRLNAPFLQVLAAVSSVPRLHIKLSMQTLQGILGDVYSPNRHMSVLLANTTSCFTHYTILTDNVAVSLFKTTGQIH